MALLILCLSPLAIALAVPAALAWQDAAGRPRDWRTWAPAIALGAGVVLAGAVAAALSAPASEGAPNPSALTPWAAGLGAAGLLMTFAFLSAALYAVPRALGAPPAAGQCLAAAVAVLLLATPFYMNAAIEAAGPEARNAYVAFTAGANPFLVLAHEAADIDPLRAPLLYRLSVCQYYYYVYPTAGGLALAYAGAALAVGAVAALAAAIRRGRSGPTAPVLPLY